MKKYLKVQKNSLLTQLNAAEFTSFFTSFYELMPRTKVPPVADETPTDEECPALGITNAELKEFKGYIDQLVDLNRVSRGSEETPEMVDNDLLRDKLVSYLISSISTKRQSPLSDEKAAAVSLYLLVKPYRGIQRSPNEQESILISGLLVDLAKESYPAKLETLGLTATIEKLKEINDLYIGLTAQRAAYQLSLRQYGTSKELREILLNEYEYIADMAQAKYMLESSEEATLFITELNALLDRTEANYNRRLAGKPAKEEEEGKGEEGEGEWTPVNS